MMVCNFLNAVDLRRNSIIFIGQKVCSFLYLHCHRPYPKQTAEKHQDLFDFQAMEFSGDFSPHGKSSVKEEVKILKVVTGELTDRDKAECWGQLHYFSILVKEPKVLDLIFRTKYDIHN